MMRGSPKLLMAAFVNAHATMWNCRPCFWSVPSLALLHMLMNRVLRWLFICVTMQLLAPCPAASRLVLGALPRSQALRPLVPEFGRYVKVLCRPSGDALMQFLHTLPKGAKITARFLNGAQGSDGQHACAPYLDHVDLTQCREQQKFFRLKMLL